MKFAPKNKINPLTYAFSKTPGHLVQKSVNTSLRKTGWQIARLLDQTTASSSAQQIFGFGEFWSREKSRDYLLHLNPKLSTKNKFLCSPETIDHLYQCCPLDHTSPIEEMLIGIHFPPIKITGNSGIKLDKEITGPNTTISIMVIAKVGVSCQVLNNLMWVKYWGFTVKPNENVFDSRFRAFISARYWQLDNLTGFIEQLNNITPFNDELNALLNDIFSFFGKSKDFLTLLKWQPSQLFPLADDTEQPYFTSIKSNFKFQTLTKHFDIRVDNTFPSARPELHKAVIANDLEAVVKILNDSPLCVFTKDPWGHTASDLACQLYHVEIYTLLVQHEEKLPVCSDIRWLLQKKQNLLFYEENGYFGESFYFHIPSLIKKSREECLEAIARENEEY